MDRNAIAHERVIKVVRPDLCPLELCNDIHDILQRRLSKTTRHIVGRAVGLPTFSQSQLKVEEHVDAKPGAEPDTIRRRVLLRLLSELEAFLTFST